MPVSRTLAEDLARTLVDIYGRTAERMAAAVALRLDQDLAGATRPGRHERRLLAAEALHEQARRLVTRLDTEMAAAVEQMTVLAAERGSAAALREMGRLGFQLPSTLADVRRQLPGAEAVQRLAFSLTSTLRGTHLRITRWPQDVYRQITSRESADILLGTRTRRQAAQQMWQQFVDKGITGFVDRSGRAWRLESYVDMASRTVAAQAAVEAHLDRLGEAGLDLVIVSDAPQECELCRPWESEVLTRSGGGARTIEREHATQDGVMVQVDVAGSVDDAVRAGLMHPNCRHSLSGYFPGITTPRAGPTDQPDPVLDQQLAAAAEGDDALAATRTTLGRRRRGDDPLTRAQNQALRDYESAFSTAINGQLRHNNLSPRMARTVAQIDSSMRPLAAEVAVWRGVGDARRLFGGRLDGDLTGLEWAERAYLSTTATQRVGRQFGSDGAGDRVLMRILAPEGTGAVRVSGSGFGEQAEILMQRGLSLRVARDRGVQADGHRLLDVEVTRRPIRPAPAARPAAASAPPPRPEPSRDWSRAVTGEEAWRLTPPLSDALFRGSRAAPANRINIRDRQRHEQALVNYTGSNYPDLQRAARTGQGAPELLQTVDDLDRLLRNTSLRVDSQLYRGIQNPQAAIPGWPASGTAEGLEWTSAGFNSTSGLREVAEQFARGEVPGAGTVTEPVVMTVLTPAGTPALQLGIGIAEVLLPRGIVLRVIRDEGTVDGVRRITVEVVTDDPA